MSVTIEPGVRVTLPDGATAVVVGAAPYLDGPRWRVRVPNGRGWTHRIVREAGLLDPTAPPVREVGESVRLGPAGPRGTVVARDGDSYTVRRKIPLGEKRQDWYFSEGETYRAADLY